MKTANEAMEEILDETDFNINELNHLIYAAATIITEEINGTVECKLQTQRSKTPLWVRQIQGSINDIRKELSALVAIRRENRKVMNINRTRLLKKYNIHKTEELDQLIEELKQKFNLIFVVPCIMLNSEINPTRCNNCVYSSQWLYSTCFG